MAVRNIVLVQPDPDRWQPSMPAFKKVIVGPQTLELKGALDVVKKAVEEFFDDPSWLWVVAKLSLALFALIALVCAFVGGKP